MILKACCADCSIGKAKQSHHGTALQDPLPSDRIVSLSPPQKKKL